MKTKTTFYSGLTALGMMLCLSTQPALGLVTITVQPSSQVVLAGSNAVFNAQVSVTAGETITAYAWLMSPTGQNPFTIVAGATTATCTLTNVQTGDSGFYFARVTFNSGTNIGVTSVSSAVQLSVTDQARIITQPQGGLIRIAGSNATFSVSALGTPAPSYQWRLNRTNLSNNGRISGATNNNLTINALVPADSGSYDVVVTNISAAVTSQVATLSVYIPVGIAVPPHNTAVIIGSNAVLSVTASGTAPIGYQWQIAGTNLVDDLRISGSTSNVLKIAATTTNDTGNYTVILTNPVSALTSSVATLTILVPAQFTSATNVTGRQGSFFSFTNTATGTTPILFGAVGLPAGLSIEPTNGVISGIPTVAGSFNVAIYATNAAMTTPGQLAITLTTGVPGITSSLAVNGKQGSVFNYSIVASNTPLSFSASTLPVGLRFDPTNGIISGVPIVSGTFPITIGVSNQYGSDSEVLMLAIATAVPSITSARTATWTENQTNFSYRIRASNTPTQYGASDLPSGLSVNPTNGIISGTPWNGGTYTVLIWAANAWGTGSTNLVLTINYATISGLTIGAVTTNWSKPFLLNFTFSLRDGPDPVLSNPVVRPPSQFQVTCMEDGVPISSEAPLILESLVSSGSKQLKTFLALDYTYSMYVVPGAIDAMEAAAELLINEEPPHALFGIVEFNADYMTPQFVTNSLTTTNNYFISDKTVLSQSIAGIQDNYVQGNYAGTRCWDAMYAALQQFGTNNLDEQRYLVAMTDGNDDSSLLNTDSDPLTAVTTLYKLAKKNHVAIYCVAFGNNVNTTALQLLTQQTGGQYYLAAATSDLASQFQKIQKDISSQYVLRWATLKRTSVPAYPVPGFQPSFTISYGGASDSWNTTIVTTNIEVIDDTKNPPVTNTVPTNVVQFPFNPPDWTNDVRIGSLRLVQDADVGPQTIRLRATYSPRFVREIRLNYRPNFPCTAVLDSTGTNEILNGWTMSETVDTNGLRTLTMISSNPTNLLTSIPYAAFGDLLDFNFAYPEGLTSQNAFSEFGVDNSIYTNFLPSGQTFTNENFTNFVSLYAQAPPHGTPVPWLINYGFTTNFADAELIATNGLPVWQDYVAGLNPLDPNSTFAVTPSFVSGQAPQVIFSTVLGRTYRVDSATTLDSWSVLRDNIPGTGGAILFIDNRILTGVSAQFYRVSVY